jgi:hypothetical protein
MVRSVVAPPVDEVLTTVKQLAPTLQSGQPWSNYTVRMSVVMPPRACRASSNPRAAGTLESSSARQASAPVGVPIPEAFTNAHKVAQGEESAACWRDASLPALRGLRRM